MAHPVPATNMSASFLRTAGLFAFPKTSPADALLDSVAHMDGPGNSAIARNYQQKL
jgi:hypothetical protein